MKNKSIIGLLLIIMLIISGCDCGRQRSQSRTTVNTEATAQNHLLDAKDLDLQVIMGWVKSNVVENAKKLEEMINSTPGVNNVDVDKDGQVDYISVKENSGGNVISLDMIAVPSSTKDPKEAVVVASLTFKKNVVTNRVEVSGGYPNYVHGYNHYYYSYHRPGLTFGEAMFLTWVFSSSRSPYYFPGYIRHYTPRRVYNTNQLRNTRTTYRKQTRVSPIKKVARPKNYNIASAKKVPSRFNSKLNKSRNTFKSRVGNTKKFRSRSGQINRRSSWGSTQKPSRSWGSSTRKPSRSWGSSTRKPSRSWGSSTRKPSRSWGSSTRRSSSSSRSRRR